MTNSAAEHLASLFRSMATKPVTGALDPLTWEVAMMSAARIVEEDAAIRDAALEDR